jgi:hypothetical protein
MPAFRLPEEEQNQKYRIVESMKACERPKVSFNVDVTSKVTHSGTSASKKISKPSINPDAEGRRVKACHTGWSPHLYKYPHPQSGTKSFRTTSDSDTYD